MSNIQKVLIAYDDDYLIAFHLAKELELLSIKTNLFITNKTEHGLNRYFFRKINKLARNLRLISKGVDLFHKSNYSYVKYLESQFENRIKEFSPDLIFCIHGQRFGEDVLQRMVVPKIGWWVEPDPNKEALVRFAKPFDVYLSYDSSVVKYLNSLGIHSKYQSHVACTSQFYPISNLEKEYDILFYGNWSAWREEVLYAAFQISKNIALYGNSWKKKQKLFSRTELRSIYKGEQAIDSNLNYLINKSKLVLNAQRLKGFSCGLDTRPFDVLASGALLVTDAPDDMKYHFAHKEDLLIYHGISELKVILNMALSDGINVEVIRNCGMRKVVNEYTYKQLCRNILSSIN